MKYKGSKVFTTKGCIRGIPTDPGKPGQAPGKPWANPGKPVWDIRNLNFSHHKS